MSPPPAPRPPAVTPSPSLHPHSVLSAESHMLLAWPSWIPRRCPLSPLSSWQPPPPPGLCGCPPRHAWATSPAGEFLCLQNQEARGNPLLPRACLHLSELHSSWNIYEFSVCALSRAGSQKLQWTRGWSLWPPCSHWARHPPLHWHWHLS